MENQANGGKDPVLSTVGMDNPYKDGKAQGK
jgi:hypothetical protein